MFGSALTTVTLYARASRFGDAMPIAVPMIPVPGIPRTPLHHSTHSPLSILNLLLCKLWGQEREG